MSSVLLNSRKIKFLTPTLDLCKHPQMTDKKTRNWGERAKKAFAKKAARRQQIKDLHASGMTMAKVAAQFRISEGRVWQIVRNYQK